MCVYLFCFVFFPCRMRFTHIIFLLLKNIDHSNRVLKILNNTHIWIKFILGYPCSGINFERTQNLKIARSFCAKFFSKIITIKLFALWQVLKPFQKVIIERIWHQRIFSISTKWLKTYETGYHGFINKFWKQQKVAFSKCRHCSSSKMTSLTLTKSGRFFFHANYRIPVCEITAKCFFVRIDYQSM